jgi:hypothetical protein
VLRNGVYSYTQVRFGFSSQDPATPVITYDATADFETLKYESVSEWNFYPGLSLFTCLGDTPGSESAINAVSYVNVG